MDPNNTVTKDALFEVLDQMAPGDPARDKLMRLLAQKNFDPQYFTYSAVYSNAAGAGGSFLAHGTLNTVASVNIQSDADFLILNTTYKADIEQGAQLDSTSIIPLVSILIQDLGSGKYLMDQGVPVPSMFGTGQFPYIWPQPYVARAKTTLQVLATNYSLATDYNLYLQFNGVKLYQY